MPIVIVSQTDTKLGRFSFQGFFISSALNAIVLSVIMQRVVMHVILLSVAVLIILSAIVMIV